ncbi:hypothetical protein X927_06265 [Petrotoga mexicana DSM 14811]|uniref:Uncharacterized protein n=1 Tax=Petrotoga mexicana DSM 14811 TaxID=1122954 RepID=A0A2K1P8X6_9BACT|nr:hypothetical protein X927_06265 [Petrotoga mexicana DSM 14811]
MGVGRGGFEVNFKISKISRAIFDNEPNNSWKKYDVDV